MTGARRAVEFLMDVNSLEGVDRAGFAMRGVEDPECVAAHTAGVAAAALLVADRLDEPVDRARILTMAVLHDLGEAKVGDIPLVTKTEEDDLREAAAADEMVEGLSPGFADALREYREQATVEARVVKAADKLQMMAKVLAYQAESRGHLDVFWENQRNFHDAGIPAAGELFDALRSMRRR